MTIYENLSRPVRELREDLAGRYEGMQPATANDSDRHPDPVGSVELTEHSAPDEEGRHWTVTLQWVVDEESTYQ